MPRIRVFGERVIERPFDDPLSDRVARANQTEKTGPRGRSPRPAIFPRRPALCPINRFEEPGCPEPPPTRHGPSRAISPTGSTGCGSPTICRPRSPTARCGRRSTKPRRPAARHRWRRGCSTWPPATATASTARMSSAGCGCGGCWATRRACWTRKRRATGTGRLGVPPRFPGPRWTRACRAVARDAEPLGFGLNPRLVAAFCAHPAWVPAYLRCATFKAWLVAADDPELAELPPPPAPWPISGGAMRPAPSARSLQ